MKMQNLLESSTPLRLLGIFLESPEERMYEKEASEKAGVSLGSANSHLAGLVKEGLLNLEKRGRMKFYSLNSSNPAVSHLKMAWNLSNPVVQDLKRIASYHGLKAFLFGPRAKGEPGNGSFDVLFLGEVENSILKQKIRGLEKARKAEINMLQFSQKDWESTEPGIRKPVESSGIRIV